MQMIINWGSIEKKTKECINNGSGKEKGKKFVDKAKKTGGVTTESGDHIIGTKEMKDAVRGMKRIVQSTTSSWPGSVASDAATIDSDGGISPNLSAYPRYGTTKVPMSFHADLSRIGYYDDADNAVLYNVIAAWNNGWHAKNPVYGISSSGRWKWSLTDYAGDHYLQKAVQEFNGSYGARYHCKATLSPMYTGGGSNLKQFRR